MRNKRRRTTKAEFSAFENAVRDLAGMLNLGDWQIYIDKGDVETRAAVCEYNAESRVAKITLNETRLVDDEVTMRVIAAHECAHLLTATLECLSEKRYVTQDLLSIECERIATVLEKIL